MLEETTEMTLTPAATNLFDVIDKSEQEILGKTQAQAFHNAMAQLLFTGIWCIKDART